MPTDGVGCCTALQVCNSGLGDTSACDEVLSYPYASFNGDDFYALITGTSIAGATASNIVDQIGLFSSTDPGSYWPICGTGSGMDTRNGLMVRSSAVTCGDATGGAFDGSTPSACEWTEVADTTAVSAWSGPLAITGTYTSGQSTIMFMSDAYMSSWNGGPWSIINITSYDNAAGFLVGQNSGPGSFNPGLWSRIDWLFDSSGVLHYCTTHYNAATEAAAMQPGGVTHNHSLFTTSGCNGFPFSALTHVSPAPSPPAAPQMFTVLSGSQFCSVTANRSCVTDGLGNHGNNERCTFEVAQDLIATAVVFDTESNYDRLTIGATQYSGITGPSGVVMSAGSTFTWYADFSATRAGFTICGTAAVFSPPPPLPPPSPPAPPPRGEEIAARARPRPPRRVVVNDALERRFGVLEFLALGSHRTIPSPRPLSSAARRRTPLVRA